MAESNDRSLRRNVEANAELFEHRMQLSRRRVPQILDFDDLPIGGAADIDLTKIRTEDVIVTLLFHKEGLDALKTMQVPSNESIRHSHRYGVTGTSLGYGWLFEFAGDEAWIEIISGLQNNEDIENVAEAGDGRICFGLAFRIARDGSWRAASAYGLWSTEATSDKTRISAVASLVRQFLIDEIAFAVSES